MALFAERGVAESSGRADDAADGGDLAADETASTCWPLFPRDTKLCATLCEPGVLSLWSTVWLR